jgi:hypothetical protein
VKAPTTQHLPHFGSTPYLGIHIYYHVPSFASQLYKECDVRSENI